MTRSHASQPSSTDWRHSLTPRPANRSGPTSGTRSSAPSSISPASRLAGAQATNVRLDAHFAAVDHEHLGAVGPTWLDATAREQLEGFRGRLDVEQDLALSRRTVVELSTRVDRLSADVESLRRQLLSVEDNDLGRLRRLDRVREHGRGAVPAGRRRA